MRKIITVLVFITCTLASAWAQGNCPHKGKVSREEFVCKQKEFIIEHAQLTQQEIKDFLPIFKERNLKRKEIHHAINQLMRQGKKETLTEEQYDKLMQDMYKLKLSAEEMEQAYYFKFREILPAEKIYRIHRAEMRFSREMFMKGVKEKNKFKESNKQIKK